MVFQRDFFREIAMLIAELFISFSPNGQFKRLRQQNYFTFRSFRFSVLRILEYQYLQIKQGTVIATLSRNLHLSAYIASHTTYELHHISLRQKVYSHGLRWEEKTNSVVFRNWDTLSYIALFVSCYFELKFTAPFCPCVGWHQSQKCMRKLTQ